jgi:hypothetical protein
MDEKIWTPFMIIKVLQRRYEIILWDEFEIEVFSDSIDAKSRRDRQQEVSLMKKAQSQKS